MQNTKKSDRIILEEYVIDKIKLRKHISYVLRHNPKSLDLEMNQNGWVNLSELIFALEKYKKLTFRYKSLKQIRKEDDIQIG